MYINDIHILYYVAFGFFGMIIGGFTDWCKLRLEEHKKVFSKDFFKMYLKNFKVNYMLIIITSILYIGVLYTFGLESRKTYAFLILIPMLITVLMIDYKKQVIPNRLTLSIFEVGLVYAFIEGILDLNSAIDSLLGMIVGVTIFLVVTLIGGIFSGKETMGFGDVKLIGSLGLFFGLRGVIIISIFSFVLAAIISIVLLCFRKKNRNEDIPFGPFIVIATFIVMLVPSNIILGAITSIVSLIKK